MPFVSVRTVRPTGRRSPEIFTVALATGIPFLIEYRTGNRARIRCAAQTSGSQHHQDKRDEQLRQPAHRDPPFTKSLDKRES